MPQARRSAVQSGIKSLYHYEPFRAEYLISTLTEQKVHFSDLAALNDPWDCRPWFDENALEAPAAIEALIDWLFSFTPTAPGSEAQIEVAQNAIRHNAE